jgi:murein DD-endopeptidase MepM/ murein hydrolase activator NlpD
MHRRTSHKYRLLVTNIVREVKGFSEFLFYYSKKKLINFSTRFERNKNTLVKFFLMKRGRYNRPFLHLTTMGVLGIGVLIAPFLANTFPVFATQDNALSLASSSAEKQSALTGQEVFQTNISSKPRDKIITYQVERGDTLGTVANKFGISANTIRWANNLNSDTLTVGQSLQILPVSGVAYKVQSGDTVYTVAKKYNVDADNIVDFPFNEFAGNGARFGLITGETLIVPNGIEPSAQETVKPYVVVATGPVPVTDDGFTWPVHGIITQFASSYHMALDIAAPLGTPLIAASSGTVDYVSVGTYDTGYGNNVWVNKGDGLRYHYAHMMSVNVSIGEHVTGGQTVIGWIGVTGNTTGPHVHFEIQSNGTLVNPLPYLQ